MGFFKMIKNMLENKHRKSKAVVLDLDNTLINTEKIKSYLDSIAVAHGLSEKEAKQIYQATRNKKGKVIFDLNVYYTELSRRLAEKGIRFDPIQYKDTLNKMYEDETIVLDGVRELMETAARNKQRIIIVSLGVEAWQEEKISFTGLRKIMQDVEKQYGIKIEKKFTTEEADEQDNNGEVTKMNGKRKALRELFGEEFAGDDVLLFNDKPDETAKLLKAFPELVAFVRQASEDERYHNDSFVSLQKEFGNRVEVNTSLRALQELLESRLKKEYEPQERDNR